MLQNQKLPGENVSCSEKGKLIKKKIKLKLIYYTYIYLLYLYIANCQDCL